jgi:hypothetical protein
MSCLKTCCKKCREYRGMGKPCKVDTEWVGCVLRLGAKGCKSMCLHFASCQGFKKKGGVR